MLDFNERSFIRTRQRFWKSFLQRHHPEIKVTPDDDLPLETNFIRNAAGPGSLFIAFEDEGDTGYLYLYDALADEILSYVHVYDRKTHLNPVAEDVRVMWDSSMTKAGVLVFEGMRGIIEVGGKETCAWLENPSQTGITDPRWLNGFLN